VSPRNERGQRTEPLIDGVVLAEFGDGRGLRFGGCGRAQHSARGLDGGIGGCEFFGRTGYAIGGWPQRVKGVQWIEEEARKELFTHRRIGAVLALLGFRSTQGGQDTLLLAAFVQ